MSVQFIDNTSDLLAAIETLHGAAVIALDTEFESNRSGTTLSLVQLTDGEHFFVVDALALRDLSAFEPLLENEAVCWVVHAGRQDIELLVQATRGIRPSRLFDTQVGWSLCGPEYQVSLAYLVARVCDTRLPKSHQNDYWLKRPLTDEQIRYAADDVKYLHQIYAVISEQLNGTPKGDAVYEATAESMRPAASRRSAVSLSSYRNLWQLDHKQRGALTYLVRWYQGLSDAERKKAAHHKVLFDIAATLPTSAEDMAAIKSVPSRFAHQTGKHLIEGYLAAAEAAEPTSDVAPPSPYASYDTLLSEAWLHCARVDICYEARIAVEIGFPQWVQKNLRAMLETHDEPTEAAEALTGWRSFLKPYWVSYCKATRT